MRRVDTLRTTLLLDNAERHLIDRLGESGRDWRKSAEFVDNINIVRDWRFSKRKANGVSQPRAEQARRASQATKASYDFEKDINVHVLQFKDGKTHSIDSLEDPDIQSTFPDQKFKVGKILQKLQNGEKRQRHIMHKDRFPDRITYFHLPANNMLWAEEAVSRYFGEDRPQFHAANRELKKQGTQAATLLKKSHWRGQLHGERTGPTSISMKPFCEAINTNPNEAEHAPRNLVLFMPYLHWETTRQRERFANEIDGFVMQETDKIKADEKTARERRKAYRSGLNKRKFDEPEPENRTWPVRIQNRALKFLKLKGDELENPSPESPPGKSFGPGRPLNSRTRIRTFDTAVKVIHQLKHSLKLDHNRRVLARNHLGQYLIDAARLFEAMNSYRDRQLVKRYLSRDPPLHPRRTLDQAYYWSLNTTRSRDRDQVVYRATTPGLGAFHTFDDKTKSWPAHPKPKKDQDGKDMDMDPCEDCRANIRKVSRVVMVDQLWMWILDERTIITCFPKRYGSNKHDPSGVHKSIRVHFENEMHNEVKSVFDLALVVFDECANGLFDRTKVSDKKPQVLEAFSEAIGNIMNKHTIAFERLWRWTDLTRKILLSQSGGGRTNSDLDVPFLDINPEGELEREIKDIIEELGIMMFITKTQSDMLKQFTEKAKSILEARVKGCNRDFTSASASASAGPSCAVLDAEEERISAKKKAEDAEDSLTWFERKAGELKEKLNYQIEQLEELHRSAKETAANVKDLLDLKQQQASVVQAWQSVRQSEEAMQQGRSIMVFTIVTIIFLPLSFMSSVFGMNAFELEANKMSLWDEITYIVPISFSVAIVAIFLSLSKWIRTLLWCIYQQIVTWIWCFTGLYWLFLHADLQKVQKAADKFVNTLKATEQERWRQGRQERFKKKLLEKEEKLKKEQDAEQKRTEKNQPTRNNGTGQRNHRVHSSGEKHGRFLSNHLTTSRGLFGRSQASQNGGNGDVERGINLIQGIQNPTHNGNGGKTDSSSN